ncbi:MAG: GNAT family N-acetyltransferase [Planctomycetota bacterium]
MPHFRLAVPEDAQQILDIYGAYCHTTVTLDLQAPTLVQMQERIALILERFPWIVLEEDGKMLGYVYVDRHREREAYKWSVNTAIYVHPERHRQGIGRSLYCSLFEVLRLQGFYNAYAVIVLPNPKSVALHEAMGFKRVGVYQGVGYKCGDWRDAAWYHLRLRPLEHDPALPRRIGEMPHVAGWEDALQAGLGFLRSPAIPGSARCD